MVKKTKASDKLLIYIISFSVMFFLLAPFTWLILSAFNAHATLAIKMPEPFTVKNFSELFKSWEISKWLLNSLLISGSVMILSAFFATLAAYPLSRLNFPGKKLLMYSILLIQLIPLIILIVPIYSMGVLLHLIDSYLYLILVSSTQSLPVNIWIMKGMVDNVPRSLEEAAWIDGASNLDTFFKIILPLVKPGILVISVLAFVGAWNQFLLPLILLNSPGKFPMSIGIFSTFSAHGIVNYGKLSVMLIVYVLPSVIYFTIGRKYLSTGIGSLGSAK